MIATLLFALGAVMIVEGLVYLLAPHALERVLEALRELPLSARRLLGAIMLVSGLIVLLLVR